MIDKEIFVQGMGQLGGAFGREIDGPVSKMYFGILSKTLTTEEFVEAVTRTIATERFWPSPAVIASKIRQSDEEAALKSFDHVRRTLQQHGGFRFIPAEIAQSFDSPSWAAIRECGGLSKMAEANEKRYVRAYLDALAPRAPRLMPSSDPRVRALTKSIGAGGQDRAANDAA